jgi:hypothetical protein
VETGRGKPVGIARPIRGGAGAFLALTRPSAEPAAGTFRTTIAELEALELDVRVRAREMALFRLTFQPSRRYLRRPATLSQAR